MDKHCCGGKAWSRTRNLNCRFLNEGEKREKNATALDQRKVVRKKAFMRRKWAQHDREQTKKIRNGIEEKKKERGGQERNNTIRYFPRGIGGDREKKNANKMQTMFKSDEDRTKESLT